MTQSAARTISSARWTACGFSILAISGSAGAARAPPRCPRRRRTNESATRSTPIFSPVSRWWKSSSGTDGSAAVSPGMLRPWREATEPPTSTSASISPSPGRGPLDPQAHRAVGQVDHLVGVDRVGEPRPGDVHAARVALLVVLAADERHVVARLELGDAVARAGRSAAWGPGGPGGWRRAGRRGSPRRARAARSRRAPRRCRGRSSGARRPSRPRPSGRGPRGRGRPDRWWRRSSYGA